ncbi:MAG: glycosyltransferase [Candidatus Absconditabacteria bacterium]|nr:glycosyltransferase [Candidatus Absconditabacteria bacterium]MDD3868683.1 glycosyltransferase [Candidatus Absconditabacteria bacterium]MDD4714170.1 glycosyltransferase [Candidatus Absconditabacteria bacterium]
MSKKTIVMTGGGTGGHVFPIRSLLETLFKYEDYLDQTEKIYRFGSSHSLEEQTAKEFGSKITFQSILSGKFRRQKHRKAYLQNIGDAFLFCCGFFQSLFFLWKYHVDSIFCKGGYVALPVVLAGKLLRKKILVHESDVHPGLVNTIASKFATTTFTGFDNVLPGAITVGQILSDDIMPSTKAGFSPDFQKILDSINEEKSSLFVMGGSQGSKILYETFAQVLEKSPEIAKNYNIFITLGKLNENLKPLFLKHQVQVFDFLSQKEMGAIYQISDLCLARGGTTSLAEQKLFNIKSIIVPIPRTHDQKDNGKRYVEHFEDILLDQKSETFLSDMKKTLLDHINYKKPKVTADIFSEIQKAKMLIRKEILK